MLVLVDSATVFGVNDALLAGAVAAVGAIIVALTTYLVARRQTSGQIANSSASDLWSESQAIRKELRDEIIELRKEILSLKSELKNANEQLASLRTEIDGLLVALKETEHE